MSAMRQDRNPTQMIVGVSVLAAGVLFTLDNMGVIDVHDFMDYWPVVFIAIGVSRIIQARYWSAYAGAVIWVLAGVWFLGRTTGVIHVGIGDMLPLFLAGLGAYLVFRGWQGYDRNQHGRDVTHRSARATDTLDYADDGWAMPSPAPAAVPVPVTVTSPAAAPVPAAVPVPAPLPREAEPLVLRPAIPTPSTPPDSATNAGGWTRPSDNTVNLFVVMGGVTRRLLTHDFKGGTAVAIMGGCKIDLRDASISQAEAVIDVLAFWGGVEIKVPEGWTVVPQVFPFMGGFDDRTRPIAAAQRQRLIVRGLAFMGGVEVKH